MVHGVESCHLGTCNIASLSLYAHTHSCAYAIRPGSIYVTAGHRYFHHTHCCTHIRRDSLMCVLWVNATFCRPNCRCESYFGTGKTVSEGSSVYLQHVLLVGFPLGPCCPHVTFAHFSGCMSGVMRSCFHDIFSPVGATQLPYIF